MAQVKAVPDGFSTVTPFFNIKGAAAAIEFYKKAFGAEEINRFTLPDSTLIMMSQIKIGNSFIRIADAIKDPPTQSSNHLSVEHADVWWKRAVDAGCKVVMPLADMFWGSRFGIVEDTFGNRWSIAQHIEDVSPEELSKRAAEAMKTMK